MFITTLGFFKKVNNSADSEAQMPIFMTLMLLCNARCTAAPSSQGTDDCGATVLAAANPSQTHANLHRVSFLFTHKVAGYEAQRTESPMERVKLGEAVVQLPLRVFLCFPGNNVSEHFFFLISKAELQRERKIYNCWFTPQMAVKGQRLARLKPEASSRSPTRRQAPKSPPPPFPMSS